MWTIVAVLVALAGGDEVDRVEFSRHGYLATQAECLALAKSPEVRTEFTELVENVRKALDLPPEITLRATTECRSE